MYGWRGLFGYINPAVIASPVRDYYSLLPDGVGIVFATLQIERLERDEVDREQRGLIDAACALKKAGAQFIMAGGGPIVTSGGPGADRRVAEAITAATGVEAMTAIHAGVLALRALGAQRIAIASPLKDELNDEYRVYFESHGFDVRAMKGLGCGSNREVSLLDDYAAYRVTRDTVASADGPVDAVYLPCGRWPAVQLIETLERDLGLPVVPTIQAAAWAGTRALGVRDAMPGSGKLFSL
jgi:maleate cis-trans isomerase